MKTESEIRDRLRELDGNYLPNEAGGMVDAARAEALLWVLGYEDTFIIDAAERTISVEEYL